MNTLTFNETCLEIVDHFGQPWLKAADIANALGYKKADTVTQIFERNKDEFTDTMTLTLNLKVKDSAAENPRKRSASSRCAVPT